VFLTEAGSPEQRLGSCEWFSAQAHAHMLCHSTEYNLANDGHDTRSLAHYL